ncbi:MAG: hypothetical protein BroJett029_14060 [Alphaproteobacteria bacterium]|nr:MAG: hypothetical protein BroJett029_14060 [Alphaproteobacteria bacterium]
MAARWSDFRPSKTLWFWSCVGCVVATMIVGFTVGGWVTGGTAEEMASDARENGRAELVAQICVDRFLDASDAASELAALKEQSTWQRDDFIQKGGWVKLAGFEEPVEGAADLCAEELAGMELPASGETAAAEPETSVN